MKAKITAAIVATLVVFSSCVKNELHDSDHPEQGKITLTTDWTKRTDGITIPESYTAAVGTHSVTLGGAKNIYPNLISPGSYTLYVFNTADKITVSGTTATVASINTTTINPMPGWLFSARADVTVVADRSQEIIVAMKQEVCQLDIVLTVTEGDPARIKSVEGILGGVAATWNFNTDSPVGDAASISPAFTKTGNKITAKMRLLGIVPSTTQNLTLTVTFSDDSQQTITKDLTSLLTGFNTDQHIARTITADVETPIETKFTCTITDWALGETRPGTAD